MGFNSGFKGLKRSFKTCVHIFDSGQCWLNCISARVILENCAFWVTLHSVVVPKRW